MNKSSNVLSPLFAQATPALLLLAVALMIASMDIYIPSLPYLRDLFGTTEWVMQFSLMLSPLVGSIGGLFYGNLSDRYGRRKTMLSAMILFTSGSLCCALSNCIYTFLAARFLQAVGGCGITVISLAILSDLFQGIKYARYIAIFGTMFPIIMAIAPLIGAQALCYGGWALNFWLLFCLSCIVTTALYFSLAETLKTRKTGFKPETSPVSFFKKLINLCSYPYFLIMALGHALPIAAVAIYLTHSAFLFIDMYHYSPKAFSYIQIIPIGMNLLGALIYQRLLPKVGLEKSLKIGMAGLVLFNLCTVIVLMVNNFSLLPYLLLFAVSLLNFGLSFNNATCATMAFEAVKEDKGLAIAMVGLIRNGLISSLVLGTAFFYNGTHYPIFISMGLVCVTNLIIISFRNAYSPKA